MLPKYKQNLPSNKIGLIFFIFLILISTAYSQSEFHPYKIKFDYSNLKGGFKGKEKEILIQEIEFAAQFLSKMIYTNNKIDTVEVNEDSLKFCYKERKSFQIRKSKFKNVDLLIIPLYAKREKRSIFQGHACKRHDLKQVFLGVLEVSNKNAQKLLDYDRYTFRLVLLHALTNLFGFDKSLLNKETLSNDYFIVPQYVTNNFWYSQSIKKYYNFTNTVMPKIEIIDEIRRSYKSYWPDNIDIPDYMKNDIDGTFMITELTFYLLKDLSFNRINKCDFELFNNKKCFRFDNKCFTFNDLYYNYFIDYQYEKDEDTNDIKIKCHLNTIINLRNKQCGVIEGNLLNEIISESYCINFDLNHKKKLKKFDNKYHIPEFDEIEYQKIKLVSPSNLCPKKHPRTIFFTPLHFSPESGSKRIDDLLIQSLNEHVEREKEKYKIEDVTLTDKKYFLSFLSYTNYMLIVQTLKGNGFVRSYLQNGNHNMLAVPPYKFNIENVNKYQFFYKRGGQVGISNKNNLHRYYDLMKKEFPDDYNYMAETYAYPEMKSTIKKKFSDYRQKTGNLWLIKPKSSSEGRGIHMFNSLEEEKGSYLITKYIENPHLLNGKKYDFRIYVLITSANPLCIYIYKQGLVRIASKNFSLSSKNLNSKFIHLTNTVVNKENRDYIFNDSIDSEKGNKWSLKAYQKYCEKMGIDFNSIFEKIKDTTVKVMLSIYTRLLKGSEIPYGHKNFYHRNYHNLFGFDYILDDELNVYLLEVNDGPSLSLYDNMDRDIKTKLMADTFNLIGLVPFAHDETQKPMDEIYEYKNRVEEEVDYALCEFTRPKGNYERIFPVKNKIEKYKKLFKEKTEENKALWEIIESNDDYN